MLLNGCLSFSRTTMIFSTLYNVHGMVFIFHVYESVLLGVLYEKYHIIYKLLAYYHISDLSDHRARP